MDYLVGIILALAVSALAAWAGFDRDRAFYPTVLAVIASYYVLFGVMAGSVPATLAEVLVMSGFVLAAVAGLRFSLWLVAAALLAHGVFDFIHARLIANPGVPAWWPGFCLAYDAAAAAFLAWRLRAGRMAARPASLVA